MPRAPHGAHSATEPAMIRSPLMTVMVQAVRKAGRSLVRDFGEVENLQVSLKGPANFVSNADRKAERILQEELTKARPAFGFLMEESGEVGGTDEAHRWIVDPLDGTTNFLHGIPLFTISLALARDGVPVAGVIFNPITDELFIAEKGAGAFMNDRRIRVAARRNLADSVLCCGLPHMGRGDLAGFRAELAAIAPKVAGLRRTGSAALDLAWTAAGRFDGFWERDLQAWDMAAGIVIVREAGGYVSDLGDGDKMLVKGDIIAGNEVIRRDLLALIRNA
jgi:myo-inositol-1(or 4)-monophosphatase